MATRGMQRRVVPRSRGPATGAATSSSGGSAPLHEIAGALSRMENNLYRVGVRTNAAGAHHSSMTPARSTSVATSHGTAPGATPLSHAHIVGPTDRYGNPLMPRSEYLKTVVSPAPIPPPGASHSTPAPADTSAVSHATSVASHGSLNVTGGSRTGGGVHAKSTMLRQLEEELRECTFQPNASRRRAARSAQPRQTTDAAAEAEPQTRAHSAQPTGSSSGPAAAENPGEEPEIFDRLYHRTTRHISRTVAQQVGAKTLVAAVEAPPPKQKPRLNTLPGRPVRYLQRSPFGPPTQPIADKELVAFQQLQRRKRREAAKPTSTDPCPPIFERLHRDAGLVDQKRREADRTIQHKQQISKQRAMENVNKWTEAEKKRDAELERRRNERIAKEREYLEAKRQALSDHIHQGVPKATDAPVGGRRPAKGATTTAAGGAADRVAPRHQTYKSTGGESTMVLTPNGTWHHAVEDAPADGANDGSADLALPPAAAGDDSGATAAAPAAADEPGPASGDKPSNQESTSPPRAARRPANVKPLRLKGVRGR